MPPPVNLVNIREYKTVHELLQTATVEHRVTALNNDVFKINVPDGMQYRRLITTLRTNNIEYYTYEDKQN